MQVKPKQKGTTMEFEELSPELQERAKACKTPEEIQALASELGYKLTKEDLDSVAGGGGAWCNDCVLHCYKDYNCNTNYDCPSNEAKMAGSAVAAQAAIAMAEEKANSGTN